MKGKYVSETILKMLLLLFAVTILSFILITKAPIDPLTSYIGSESTLSPAARQQIADYWGLNPPLVQRYFTWLGNIFRGDFGMSITYKRPVIDVIGERFSASLVLMLLAWLCSGVLGFFLGMASGKHKGSVFDKITQGFCLVLQSTPTFWIGILFLELFSVTLGWFPLGMSVPMGVLASQVTLGDRMYHLFLPFFTLTVISLGKITLYTRQKYIEEMNNDYILFAKARGESSRQILNRHIMRNIALPAVTVQFASFSELFGGMTLAETVFSYPGIGTATTAAATHGDVPLLLGITLFSALFVFTGNLIANLLYGVLDPRMREGALHA